jgi:hypothetical protein
MISIMKRSCIYLSESQAAKLRQVADTTGLSVAEHIRRAVDEYLVRLREGPGRRNSARIRETV